MNKTETSKLTFEEKLISRIDDLISVVLDAKSKTKLNLDVTLWNTSDVARYIGVSYKYTSEYIVTHHEFSFPVRLPTRNGKIGHPRWYAGEVIKWVRLHRGEDRGK